MFVSLPDSLRRKVQGSVFVAPLDDNFMPAARPISLGSCTVELDIKPEYVDFQDNQSPLRDRTFSKCVSRQVSLKFGYEQYVGLLLKQLYQASTQSFVQVASAGLTMNLPAAIPAGTVNPTMQQVQDSLPLSPYNLIQLHDAAGNPVFNATNVVVTDGTNPLPLGSYVVEPITGKVQLVAVPVSGVVDITFSSPAITAAQGVTTYNILQQAEFYAQVYLRQNTLMGQPFDHFFPKVHMRAAQSVKLIGGDNQFQKTDVECPVLFDSRYPGQEMGFAVTAIKTN